MDTTSYVVLVSFSTIRAHVKGINPIHYYCMLILHYHFYYLLHIWCQQTVLTNMLCYTSLCTSSTLGMSVIFSQLVYSVSFPSSTPPINKLGLLAWVHTFHLAIACVRLGGSLTPPYSYLPKQLGWEALFSGWVHYHPNSFNWVCLTTAQVSALGFVSTYRPTLCLCFGVWVH